MCGLSKCIEGINIFASEKLEVDVHKYQNKKEIETYHTDKLEGTTHETSDSTLDGTSN